jgi:hypothetical protein
MKKALLVLMAALMVMAITGLVGCGGTSVKVDTGTGKVEVSSPKGSLKIETKTPTEAELGVPIYPGAKAIQEGSISTTEGQSSYSALAPFVTDDSVSKVVAWYKEKLQGKAGFTDMSTPEGGLFSFQSGNETKIVTIGPGTVELKGKTAIAIMTGSTPPGTQ